MAKTKKKSKNKKKDKMRRKEMPQETNSEVPIEQRGLYGRYQIMHTDCVQDGPIDIKGYRFVLRLDKRGSDPKWTEICRYAARKLVKRLRKEKHLLKLADELWAKIKELEAEEIE
jgi:hypothetical protein